MALLNLVYRDQLFPRRAYRAAFEALLGRLPASGRPAASWSSCWRWRTSAPARPNSAAALDSRSRRRPIARPRCLARTLRARSAHAMPDVIVELRAARPSTTSLLGTRPTGARHEDDRSPSTPPASTLLLNELRLPAIKLIWADFAEQADKEGWPAARFLAALAEHEMAERGRRRIERHLAEARLPPGKTLDTFDFDAVPMVSQGPGHGARRRRQLARTRAPICCCSAHPAAARAISRPPSASPWSRTAGACCSPAPPTSSSGCRSRAASSRSRPPSPSSTSYHLLILDDLAYVTKDQAETSVLFELISARYERRSMLITANQPFGEWGKVFPDPGHDARRRRPPRPPRHDLRDERRKLSPHAPPSSASAAPDGRRRARQSRRST